LLNSQSINQLRQIENVYQAIKKELQTQHEHL